MNNAIDMWETWAEALDSGTYNQTQGNLKDANGYCCLGVLLDSGMKTGFLVGEWEELPSNYPGPSAKAFALRTSSPSARSIGALDPFTRERLGMPSVLQSKLIMANDGEGLSFEQIAAYVRRIIDALRSANIEPGDESFWDESLDGKHCHDIGQLVALVEQKAKSWKGELSLAVSS